MSTPHTLSTLKKQVERGQKFTMITAYDATFSELISTQGVESILIGDSLGMVCQGHTSTLPVTMDDMVYHTQLVSRGNKGAFLVADLPFSSYHTVELALHNASRLMQAGANMIKLEGGAWLSETIIALRQAGIPVCAHLGLTPQSINLLGGYKVQGRSQHQSNQMLNDAQCLEAAGAEMLLLECTPTPLTQQICQQSHIPVVGIGAGPHTDAQVLVCYDLLGLTQYKLPRFVKNFMADQQEWKKAIAQFQVEVKTGEFPAPEHCFE